MEHYSIDKPRLIMFCGVMGCGKDTFGECYNQTIKEKYPTKKTFHFSFAQPLREELNNITKDYINHVEIQSKYSIPKEKLKDFEFILKTAIEASEDNNIDLYKKIPEIRNLLQFFGTDIRRYQNLNYWTKKGFDIIKNKLEQGYFVYVTDGRFLNEFETIKSLGGKLVLLQVSDNKQIERIKKRDSVKNLDIKSLSHSSEKDFYIYKNWDFIIDTDNVELNDIQDYLKSLNIF